MRDGIGTVDDPMTDDTRWIAALRTSHDRFAGLVAGLSDEQVAGPSYDDDWTIADVASHLGSQAEIFAPFLDAGLTGAEPPGNDTFPVVWDRWDAMAPSDQVRESVERNEAFVRRLEGLAPDERSRFAVALFGAPQDLAGFAAMRLGEHAMHTWDVAVALDPSATVSPDAAELLVDRVGAQIGRFGRPVEGAPPVVVATTSPARTFHLELEPTVSSRSGDPTAPSGPASADVTLPAEAFLRLVYGRLDAEHTPEGLADDATLVTLRQAFPGF